jgi:hypothetical protein
LENRLGVEAVENITTCQQRESNIWDYLEQWKGIGKWLSDNAQLNDLKVNGISIDDFDPQKTDYIYNLPSGATEIPVITYSTADSLASATVKNASSIPGSSEIAVTAENGITKKVYSLKFTKTTGVSDTSNGSFKVYPNPVSSVLYIESVSTPINNTFTISSVDGKIMFQGKCTSKKQQINLSRIDSGMYFLNIEGMSNAVKLFKQ